MCSAMALTTLHMLLLMAAMATSGMAQINSTEELSASPGPFSTAVQPQETHSQPGKLPGPVTAGNNTSQRIPPRCPISISTTDAFRVINAIISCVVFIVGMVGNATLLRIIYQHKCMRNGPNALIASLAMGDLIYIIVCIPTNVYKVGTSNNKI